MGYDFGVGREAPTFTLSAVDGSEIKLKQYRGDWFPVLVFLPTQAPGAARACSSSAQPPTRCGACAASWSASATPVATTSRRSPTASTASRSPCCRTTAASRAYGALREDGTVRPMAFIVDRAGKIVWTGEGEAALEAPTLIAAFRRVVR